MSDPRQDACGVRARGREAARPESEQIRWPQFHGRKKMAHQTKPVIGINADYVPTSKLHHAHLRLPIGYADAVLAAGGLPVVLPPLGSRKELDAFLDRV